MTSGEISYIRYHKLKDKGLCPKCGQERDRQDRVFCTSCAEKSQARRSADYHWYVEHNICPYCKTNSTLNNESACIECRAEIANRKATCMEDEEYRKRYNEQARVLNRKAYYRNKEAGLCVNCRRSVEEPDKYTKCSWCRAKYRERHRKKMLKNEKGKTQQQIWKDQGLCYLCGGELYDKHGLCERHYMIFKDIRRGKHEQALPSAM